MLVTTRFVDYEPYWKRKCEAKWHLTDPAQYGVKPNDDEEEPEREKATAAAREEKRKSILSGALRADARKADAQNVNAADGGLTADVDSTVGRPGSYKTAFFERTLAEKIEQFIPHDEATSAERTQDLVEFLTHAQLVVRKLKIEQLYGSRPVVPADEWEKNEEEEEGEEEDEEKKREEEEEAAKRIAGEEGAGPPAKDFFGHLRGERMDHIDLLPVLAELPMIQSIDICYK